MGSKFDAKNLGKTESKDVIASPSAGVKIFSVYNFSKFSIVLVYPLVTSNTCSSKICESIINPKFGSVVLVHNSLETHCVV